MTERVSIEIVAKDSGASRVLRQIKDDTENLDAAMSTISKAGMAVFGAALAAIIKLGSSAVNAYAESETALSRLNATLIATGQSGTISAEAIANMADSLARVSSFDDEAIVNAADALLRLENVTPGNLQATLATLMDLAAASGTDLATQAETLSRALETGVIPRAWGFSAALKEQIKSQIEAGDTGSALTTVLGELNQRYSGQAAAQLDTYAGKWEHLKVSWENFLESQGKAPAGGLGEGMDAASARLDADAIYYKAMAIEKARQAMSGYDDALEFAQRAEKAGFATTGEGIQAYAELVVKLEEAKQAAILDGSAQRALGDDYKYVSASAKDAGDSIALNANSGKTWLDSTLQLNTAMQNHRDILAEIKVKNDQAYIDLQKGKISQEEYNAIIGEGQKIAIDAAAAERAARNDLIFTILQQKLAVGGLNDAEAAYLIDTAVGMGKLDAAAGQQARDLMANADAQVAAYEASAAAGETYADNMADNVSTLIADQHSYNMQLGGTEGHITSLAALSGSVWVYTFQGRMTGSWPGFAGGGTASGQNLTSTVAGGGTVYCFIAGTPILVADETELPIESLAVGDWVRSWDEEFGIPADGEIVKIFEHDAESYLLVNGSLGVTHEHPLFINGNWMPARELKTGDVLQDKDGKAVIVKTIETITQAVKVYNLEVHAVHNYFAGGVLVHNKGEGEAAGGPVTGGQTYLVGERGPELFVPSNNGEIVPNRDLSSMTGPATNYFYGNVTLQISQDEGASLLEMR